MTDRNISKSLQTLPLCSLESFPGTRPSLLNCLLRLPNNLLGHNILLRFSAAEMPIGRMLRVIYALQT